MQAVAGHAVRAEENVPGVPEDKRGGEDEPDGDGG